MPLQEFWNDDPDLLWAYRKSYMEKEQSKQEMINFQSWLQGYYIRIAIASVFNEKAQYLTRPIELNAKPKTEKEKKLEIAQKIKSNTKKGKKIFASASTKSRIKSMFNLMLDYALEYEIVDRNYARTFELSGDIVKEVEENKQEHIIFSDSEMKTLWENINQVKFVDWILIQCYMGWRPQELATLRLDEVHLDEWYMQAGMKTEAGKQRIVPIHTKIKELVKQNYDFALSINSEYLFNDKGQTHAGSWAVTYDKYANRFKKVMEQLKLNPEHRPHDPRKTFITMAKKANMDEYALKEIVGHSVKDITESTYTVRDLEWLRNDLQKIQ